MKEPRVRQLVWLVIAISALLLSMTAWSELRLRQLRNEINALTSETDELGSKNKLLRDRVESQLGLRSSLKSAATVVRLEPVDSSNQATATAFFDREARRALVVVTALSQADPDSEEGYSVVVLDSTAEPAAVPFEITPSGSLEILLTDLPIGTSGFAIVRQDANGVETVLSGSVTNVAATP